MSLVQVIRLFFPIIILLFSTTPVFAENSKVGNSPELGRFRLRSNPSLEGDSAKFPYSKIEQHLLSNLDRAEEEFSRIFGVRLSDPIIVELTTRAEFVKKLNAPLHTEALYFRGRIYIAIDDARPLINVRTLRHEFVHALVAQMGDGRTPAWLDEGLAQYFEGIPLRDQSNLNKFLKVVASRRHAEITAVPELSELHDGFGSWEEDIARLAYGKSLFATRRLIEDYGLSSLREYLQRCSSGGTHDDAFLSSFRLTEQQFDKSLRF
jgi:hypothetical protein